MYATVDKGVYKKRGERGKKRMGKSKFRHDLRAGKEDVRKYLREMHGDSNMEEELEHLLQPEEPNQLLNESPAKLKKVVDVIKKPRAASAPGPKGVNYMYKVNKNTMKLTTY